ncbi:MAG: hypothetical protein H0W40_10635 [Methylibium sp.]|uniref:hypothetical protein n=1 Tax=Methylibium sp. TaxID=2067992 RepID=UPI0017F36BF9|nr:hypothetical protein [Methylibium sp.]MBA3597816.1 hypothetical protein [Methylibium sp.]
MPPPRSLPLPHRPGRWLAALLVFALLGLQTLGQAHRVLHPQTGAQADDHGQHHGHSHGVVPALPAVAPRHHEAGHGWSTLFGHQQQADACQLYDQLSLGDMAFAAVELVTALPLSGAAGARLGMAPNVAIRLAYQARGPPPITA